MIWAIPIYSIHWHPDAVPWRCLFHPHCTTFGLNQVSSRSQEESWSPGVVRALEFLPSLASRDEPLIEMDELISQLGLEELIERYATGNFVPIPDRILSLTLED